MSGQSSWKELAYASMQVLDNDGTLDMTELNFLLELAFKDEIMDDNEKSNSDRHIFFM